MNLTGLLSFRDVEMKALYAHSNFAYYSRSTILITILVFLIAATL